jgi:hypothetical protein
MMHPLCLVLGSLNEQSFGYEGEIQKREGILHLAARVDHEVIDGTIGKVCG